MVNNLLLTLMIALVFGLAAAIPAVRLHLGVTGGFGLFNVGANDSPFGTYIRDTYSLDPADANQWAITIPYGGFVRYDVLRLIGGVRAIGVQSGATLTFQGYGIETAPNTYRGLRIETVEVPLLVNVGLGSPDAGRPNAFWWH